MTLMGLKLVFSWAVLLLEALGGESVTLSIPASGGHLHSLAHVLFLHLQSQYILSSLISLFILEFFSVSLTFLYLSLKKDPCGYTGPIYSSQDP